MRMAGGAQLPSGSGAVCRYCSKGVASGLKCVKCGGFFHPSCSKRVKNMKIVNDELVMCCEEGNRGESSENSVEEVNMSEGAVLERLERLERENTLLGDLLAGKDAVINSLREEIYLLKENIILYRENKFLKNNKDNSEIQLADVEVKKSQTKKPDSSEMVKGTAQHRFTVNETKEVINSVNKQMLKSKQVKKMEDVIALGNLTTPALDEGGFQLVQHRSGRRRFSSVVNSKSPYNKNHSTVTVGTKEVHEKDEFKARPSKMWLYIGRVNEGVDEEKVERYIRGKCANANADDLVVEQLNTRGRSPSFRVGIDRKYYEALREAEFWPAGIMVRRYNFKSNKTTNNAPENPVATSKTNFLEKASV